jgi:hypothetical protein
VASHLMAKNSFGLEKLTQMNPAHVASQLIAKIHLVRKN